MRVFLDVCVLVPARLGRLLMALGANGHYRCLWSEDVLLETERALLDQYGLSQIQVLRRLAVMRENHPLALVDQYQHLIEKMPTADLNDRHVLAAAVTGEADVLVTANLDDFPSSYEGVEVIHPDAFLAQLLNQSRAEFIDALETDRARNRNPPLSLATYLEHLGAACPNTVAALQQLLPSSQ